MLMQPNRVSAQRELKVHSIGKNASNRKFVYSLHGCIVNRYIVEWVRSSKADWRCTGL